MKELQILEYNRNDYLLSVSRALTADCQVYFLEQVALSRCKLFICCCGSDTMSDQRRISQCYNLTGNSCTLSESIWLVYVQQTRLSWLVDLRSSCVKVKPKPNPLISRED